MCEPKEESSALRQRKSDKTNSTTPGNKNTPRRRPWRRSKVYTEALFYGITSRNADGVLAAVGAGLCLGLLTYASHRLQIPMMASFLIGASVKMFLNREPPALSAFYKSSTFCIVMGTVMHYVLQHLEIPKEYAAPLLVTLSMLYWKLGPNAELWAPANNLAIYLATDPWRVFRQYPWYYLWAPYLTGHLWIYGFAWYWSKLRRWVRAKLATRDFFVHESNYLTSTVQSEQQQEERLRDLFDRMDVDHNGRLDVRELQLAFRKALECDLTLDEARFIMKSADTDGDETLDFYEFRSAVMDRVPYANAGSNNMSKCD